MPRNVTSEDRSVGKYLSLADFCTCTNTYQKYSTQIDPFPKNPESIRSIEKLNQFILDPIIDLFGKSNFKLTYGFCSRDLKKYLEKKDPLTGLKNGRIDPSRDQHMALELKNNGKYYCERLGAACDFSIENVNSDRVIDWIVSQKLPFDSIYYYGIDRSIHISYGEQHKRALWTFSPTGVPSKKGLESWLRAIEQNYLKQ
jgi:hypothetical protein